MLKNNNMGHDRDGEHLERVLLLSKNIDTYAAELNVTGDDLADCRRAGADWTAIVTVAHVESGEAVGATQSLTNTLKNAYSYYVYAREILLATINAEGGDDNLIEEYGIKGTTLWYYDDLYVRISQWLETDRRFVDDGNPCVVDRDIIEGLNLHLTNISERWHGSQEAHREKFQAYADKRSLFERQNMLLNIILGKAKLHWGNDDPRLKDLGFVPKSEIWTIKGIPPPKNFVFDDTTGIFSWDAVEGAEEYELHYRPVDSQVKWYLLYRGEQSSTEDHPSSAGTYDFKVRAITEEKHGKWSITITEVF